MERHVDLKEISDGKLYGLEDMVRADCAGCAGCSACCMGMGSSVVLDPYDAYRMVEGTGIKFEGLLQKQLELNVVDGIILPNLRMAGEKEACVFLNEEGRCSIHPYRPGICRIFPLGRLYENGSFQYILQVHECKKSARAKVKVKKWIDTPNAKQYDEYITRWHYFLKDLQNMVKEDESTAKNVSIYVLQAFYLMPYDAEKSFYEQVYGRMEKARNLMGLK